MNWVENNLARAFHIFLLLSVLSSQDWVLSHILNNVAHGS